MLKWISPLIARFKLAPRPRLFWVPAHAAANGGQPTFGQKLAERVAAFVGSWAFLSAQAAKRVRSVGESECYTDRRLRARPRPLSWIHASIANAREPVTRAV